MSDNQTAAARRRAAWADPEATATTLAVLFLDRFGTAGLEWDPETVAEEVEDEEGVALPVPNRDRLLAAITVLTTDFFYHDVRAFETLCNVLCGSTFDPHVWDPAEAAECAWGITEVLLLETLVFGPPDEPGPFSPAVTAYVREATRRAGIADPPDVLAVGGRPARAAADYSDDPPLAAEMAAASAGRAAAVTAVVRGRLGMLIDQLEELPLSSGTATEVASQLRNALSGHGRRAA